MSKILERPRDLEGADAARSSDPAIVATLWRFLEAAGRDRRLALAAVSVGVVLAGVLLALVMPRGPATSGQAFAALGSGLTVGFASGLVLRSRWALLLAPVVFVTVFELVRIDAVGPTVDAPSVSVLGFGALVLGRGFDGLLLLLPMLLGAALGAALARRHALVGAGGHPTSVRGWQRVRRVLTGSVTFGLIVLAVGLVRPASTPAITAPDGQPLAGSVAELTSVTIGGHDQVLMIRGVDADAPVLLWLAGGPGGSDIGAMRKAGSRLESAFVVATWEQRGAGKSFAALEPTETMTLEQAVADTLEVTDHLRERFGHDRIYLAGNSWGTIPGILAAQRHPERFHAFVGAGQMVDPLETDRMFYEDTLAYAREHGDTGLEDRLVALGPPPYDRFLDYSPAVFTPGGEMLWNDYPRMPGSVANSEFPGTLFVDEYSLLEKVRTMGATLDTLAVLYPELQDVDFRETAPRLEVPVYLAQGRYEARGRAVPVAEWFAQLAAPHKEMVVFERSGHRPMFEEPDRFYEFMTDRVLAGRGWASRPSPADQVQG
jgi:proline iminopeptidase